MKKIIPLLVAVGLLLVQACKKNETLSSAASEPGEAKKSVNAFASGDPVVNGVYKITNNQGGLALETYGQQKNDGALVQQWGYLNQTSQQWVFIAKGSGYFNVINLNSGKYLTAFTGTNPQLQQKTVSGADAQLWKPEFMGYGYRLISKIDATGKVATNAANNGNNGNAITLQSWTNAVNQYWQFTQISTEVAYPDVTVTDFFKRSSGAVAFDGALSIPVAASFSATNTNVATIASTSKIVWVNGDSRYSGDFTAPNPPQCNFNQAEESNTTLVQTKGTAFDWNPANTPTVRNPAGSASIFSTDGATDKLWPGSGVQTTSGAIEVICQDLTPNNLFIKQISLSNYSMVNKKTIPLADVNGVMFYNGSELDNGYVYVYGYKQTSAFDFTVYLARYNTSTYELSFWNKNINSYDTNKNNMTALGTCPSSGISVKKINNSGQYLVTATDLGNGIYASVMASRTSLFAAPTRVYTVQEPSKYVNGVEYKAKIYTTAIHPELTANGEISMTYCVNQFVNNSGQSIDWCNSGGQNNSYDYYRPRGIKIPVAGVPGLTQ